jgi:glycosyltransferase involved in cell wall biosynthesis
MYLLSVCIPTFNREQNLKKMLDTIRPYTNVEIVICDDGSTDNTRELVDKYCDKLNIKYIYQDNAGVSAAILKAYKNSSGKYVIKMDSDDLFTENGLDFILDTIKNNLDQAAFLYGVQIIRKKFKSKNLPPNGITNFINADFKVKGDLKQVVSREIVLKYMYEVPIGVRRIPPGLLWTKIAEDYNCLSFSNVVAIKNYLDAGITSNMLYLKTSYPAAMVELNRILSESKVYNSSIYRWRSRLLWARYSFHNNSIFIRNWWHWFVFIPGWCIYIIDKIRLTTK